MANQRKEHNVEKYI